jgi:hypothetical protein
MSGAIPPLSQYALMAWCSVKAQGKLYLFTSTFTVIFSINNIMVHKNPLFDMFVKDGSFAYDGNRW